MSAPPLPSWLRGRETGPGTGGGSSPDRGTPASQTSRHQLAALSPPPTPTGGSRLADSVWKPLCNMSRPSTNRFDPVRRRRGFRGDLTRIGAHVTRKSAVAMPHRHRMKVPSCRAPDACDRMPVGSGKPVVAGERAASGESGALDESALDRIGSAAPPPPRTPGEEEECQDRMLALTPDGDALPASLRRGTSFPEAPRRGGGRSAPEAVKGMPGRRGGGTPAGCSRRTPLSSPMERARARV